MKYLIISLSFLAITSYGGELVLNYGEIAKLQKELDEHPIYLVRRILRDQLIERSDLGKPLSPFYKDNNTVKRNYQNYLGQCFVATFFENSIEARKSNCSLAQELTVNFNDEVYEEVKTWEQNVENSIVFGDYTYSRTIEAFHHEQRDYVDNSRGEMPFSIVTLSLNASKVLTFQKDLIEIKSSLKMTRSPYAFLSEKDEVLEQSLRIEPKKGDFVFKSNNRFILVKRYQPKPLDFRALSFSASYVEYLENIESNFFSFEETKRCFRDSYVYDLAYDCDFLIFKKQSIGTYQSFNFIAVDVDRSEVLFK